MFAEAADRDLPQRRSSALQGAIQKLRGQKGEDSRQGFVEDFLNCCVNLTYSLTKFLELRIPISISAIFHTTFLRGSNNMKVY